MCQKNLTLSQKKTPSLLVQTVERQGISEQDWLEIKITLYHIQIKSKYLFL